MEIDAPGPTIVVVDRYPNMPAKRMVSEWRYQSEPRKEPLRDAPVIGVRLTIPPAEQCEATWITLDLKDHVSIGLDVIIGLGALVHRIVINLVAVHIGNVTRVDTALHGLQVVALLQAL